MENKKITVSYEDIKNYWITLFPEFDTMDELDCILKKISDVEPDNIERFIKGYDDSINTITQTKLFQKNKSDLLDSISDDIKNEVPFYNFFKPIFNYFIEEYYDKIKNFNIIEDEKIFITNFIKNECINLLEFSQRTLVLEVNIARMQGMLKGNSKTERFNYYVDTLLTDDEYLKSVYKEYSHLYKLLVTRCLWNFEFLVDILSNTKKNLNKIKSTILNTTEEIKIKFLSMSLGDSHNKGKTVSIIYFNNGRKIIFKPRSLELEEGFNEFIHYLNLKDSDVDSQLYKMKVINCGNYGFCEFINHKECKDEEEIKEFYYKTGKLLGALFALNAKDIHHENIIACGNNPIVIDLEALFHSDITLLDKRFFTSIEVAQKIIDSSVYSIGFLPQKISNPYNNDSSTYVDVSAFGGEDNQVAPFKAMKIINGNTDELKIEKVDGYITTQSNNPKVNGKIFKSENYVNEIRDGFEHVYNILAENKSEFIELIKSIFKGTRNRFILRPTYIYGQLINTSYHPDFMRDEIHRYVLLHRLGVNIEDKFYDVVKSEINDILHGDVPYFYSYIDSTKIKNSNHKDIGLVLDESPLSKVINKISNLSEEDKERQLYFIHMSFLAKTTNSNKDETNIALVENDLSNTMDKDKFKELSVNIGDYIISKSICGYDNEKFDRTWISTVLIGRDECEWCLAPVGNSLYEGNSGIALFLAYLGKVTGEKRFIKAATEALEGVIHEIEVLDTKYPFLVGAYNGISGYFYTISKIYTITGNERLLNIIKNKIHLLKKLIPRDKNIDVISGVSGTIGVLLSIYNDINDDELRDIVLDLCKQCLNHIKNTKVSFSEESIAWGEGGVYMPATGFAHGNAGIIAYLIKLYDVIHDDEILDIIKRALKFERDLYSDDYKNWFSSDTNRRVALAWCHGAPGILLSRLILKEYGYYDEILDNEIKIALETTIKGGFGNNPSFCHGDLGNLSIVKYAAKILKDKKLENRCENTFNSIFNNVIKERWNKGVFSGTESMGLMVGLSSFGYALLRESENDIPDILWF